MTAALELFRCVPLSCRMTRRACGERHLLVRSGEYKRGEQKIQSQACHDCAIGRAHSDGKTPARWPDGSPLSTSDVAPMAAPVLKPRAHKAPQTPSPTLVPISTQEPAMPAEKFTHAGESLTAEQWGVKLGITGTAVRARIKKWGLARAVTEGRTGVGGQPSQQIAPSKAARKPVAAPTKAVAARSVPRLAVAPPPAGGLQAVLQRLGYVVEDLGAVPRGRVLLVTESAA